MKRADCFVSVVAPLSNDADILEPFVSETLTMLRANYVNHELILVDDGSTDDTAKSARALVEKNAGMRFVRLSRRFGDEIAIAAGLDAVIGDYVGVVEPNTDPPDLVPDMVERCRAGAGIVFGVARRRAAEPFWHRIGVKLFYWYANKRAGLNIPEDSTHLRVMSRQAVNAVTQIKDRQRYLRTFGAYVGYDNQSVEYDPINRRGRVDHKSFTDAVRLATSIVVMNTSHPLRVVSILGLVLSLVNAGYIGYVMVVYLVKNRIAEGWATLSLQSSVMFFFMFLILTVLSEYVGRILSEIRERPLYYVSEEHSSSTIQPDVLNVVRHTA